MIDMGLVTIAGLPRSGAGGQETGKEVNRHRSKAIDVDFAKAEQQVVAYVLDRRWEGEKLARILPHAPRYHHFPVGAEVLVKVRSDGFGATPTEETLRKFDGRNEYMPTFQYLHREHFELVDEVVDAVVSFKVGDHVIVRAAKYHGFRDGDLGVIMELLGKTHDGRDQFDVKVGTLPQIIYREDLTRA